MMQPIDPLSGRLFPTRKDPLRLNWWHVGYTSNGLRAGKKSQDYKALEVPSGRPLQFNFSAWKIFEIPTMYSRAKPPKHVHPKRILNRIPPPKKI